ncbi:MAG: homoserine dehydrogenase, partial [Myxococcales bacterium]|nr:homoserine dehydrogenase [Myxococcales bacterium]
MKRTEIRVGLIGVGVVGQGILRLLSDNAKQIRERLGVPIVMARMVARDPKKARTDGIARDRLTFNPKDVTQNPNIDIVVEVMGGVDPAYDIVREAIANGKHVVTANKALMAERGNELIELAERKNVDLYFEGAVAGGVPILRLLREAMSSDRITRLRGIVNGTSNYVLTEMGEKGLSFDAAVRGAQEKGYAEADPTLDISGGDAAHKLTILATLAFGAPVRHAD